MPTEVRHLRIIVMAADCGSFSSAASRLNTDISAVSRAVREVEETLGAAVFDRLPRGVRLTAAGKAYVASAREILARLQDAEQRARTASENGVGELNVGVVWPVTSGPIAKLLATFTSEYPAVSLKVAEDGNDALLARVRSGELDVALTVTDPPPYPPLRVHPDLADLLLWLEPLAVAVPISEPVDSLTWMDLAHQQLLCRPTDDWRRFVTHVERMGGPTLRFTEQDVSGEGLLSLVGAGLGWSIVPASLATVVPAVVKLVPVTSTGRSLQVELVWLRRTRNLALSRFLELAGRLHPSLLNGEPSQSLDRSP